MIPAVTPVAIAELNSLGLDVPVGSAVDDWAALPALRVAKTGDYEAPTSWEATPIFQIEVWAESEGEAEDLAYRIKNLWPHYTRHEASISGEVLAVVHGRWVDGDPWPLPAPDDTEHSRFVLSLGIRLSGVTG